MSLKDTNLKFSQHLDTGYEEILSKFERKISFTF